MNSEELISRWDKERDRIKKEIKGDLEDMEMVLQQCDDTFALRVDALRLQEEKSETL